MAEITNDINDARKASAIRVLKHNLKIDMTPMVDLGFLLISFFVITTELIRPTAMNLFMPKDGPPGDLGESNALTFLLDDNKIFYYHGDWSKAKTGNTVHEIHASNIIELRRIIIDKLNYLSENKKAHVGKDEMMVLIKPGQVSNYKTVVDVLDEINITMVKKYAIVKLTNEESAWLSVH
jgi:biopolymer transport protein ExbD